MRKRNWSKEQLPQMKIVMLSRVTDDNDNIFVQER
jgi:hypothetical protein